MSRRTSTRRRLAGVAVAATLAVALAACTGGAPDPSPSDIQGPSVTGEGQVEHAGFAAELADSDRPLVLAAPTLDDASFGALQEWADAGLAVGAPMEVVTDRDVPASGITLTRTFPVPLPDDVSVTLAYYDEAVQGWFAVPSSLSADGRSVTATVDHLSLWTTLTRGAADAMNGFTGALSATGTVVKDATAAAWNGVQEFNAAVEDAFVAGAEELYYTVGKVFDVRVDPPTCDEGIPDWAESTSFIETDRNNPVLWCVGHDPRRPEILVVKARVNRGYGTFAVTSADPVWTHNSTFDQDVFDAALAVVTDADDTLALGVAALTGGGRLVGPGQEISFGFTVDAARSIPMGQPLVTLAMPRLNGFLATSFAQAATQSGAMALEGTLAAVVAVASCSEALTGVSDIQSASRALLTCVTGFDDVIARKLAVGLVESGVPATRAGRLAGSLLGKVTVWSALIGPVFNIMNYTADSQLVESARTLVVFTRGGSAPPATATGGAPGAPGAIGRTPDPYGFFTPIIVVMDTSGSMEEVVTGTSRRRIDEARSAALDLIANLGTGQQFGLFAYPGRDSASLDGCQTGRLEVAPGPLDVAAASAAVRRLAPDGGTPTGPTLRNAADFLRATYGGVVGGVIVVVSDGEANCGPPPCDVAREVRDEGLEVQFNTVGLNLDGDAREQMECVADVGGGTYIDVHDGGDITEAIARAAQGAVSLDVDAPNDLTVVTGSGDGGATITVTVGSNGRVGVSDVRVSVGAVRSGASGVVLVPRPVRFLGNLEPGDTRVVEFTIRPDDDAGTGTARLTVTASAANARTAQWTGDLPIVDTLTPSRLGGVLAGVERVVVLGDSYSAGEGARSYQPGTDGDTDGANACHRSDLAYGAALWGSTSTTNLACSGAVTGNLTGPQESGGVPVRPQLLQLRDVVTATNAPGPEAVVLSIGGNDADFADVAAACVESPGCSGRIDVLGSSIAVLPETITSMRQRALAIEDDVHAALEQVDAAVNDSTALAVRGGDPIPIVVVPYPRPIPRVSTGDEAPPGCFFGASGPELVELNQYLDAINTSVTSAALALRAERRPVYVATDVIDAFQPDHTLCESSATYANHITKNLSKVEWLHPNPDGYEAMARALVSWSTSNAARPIEVSEAPTWSPRVVTRAPVSWWHRALSRPLVSSPLAGYAGSGEPVYVEAEGYAPGTGLVIRLDSSPRVLDTATADARGRAIAWVRLPADTPRGPHRVVVFGQDVDGANRATVLDLHVLPVGGRGMLVGFFLGVACLALAGTLLLRGPVRPSPVTRPRRWWRQANVAAGKAKR